MTDPDQGQSSLARICSEHVAEIYTDFQGLDLMDSPRQRDGQDHPPTDQQPPGQTEVEPISARKLYCFHYLLRRNASRFSGEPETLNATHKTD